jgi:hypothetical protein
MFFDKMAAFQNSATISRPPNPGFRLNTSDGRTKALGGAA